MHDAILVPIDGSEGADAGLSYALGLAGALKARLVLLHVIDVEPLFLQTAGNFEEHRQTLREYARELLATAAMAAQDRGIQVSSVLHETVDASAAALIVAEAVTQGCSLIVLGTHGRRKVSKLLGGDAEQVLRDSVVPVLFVRALRPDEARPQFHGAQSAERKPVAA